MPSQSDRTAAGCMFVAYDALVGAAERFEAEGDKMHAEKARWLASEVALADPRRSEEAGHAV